MRAIRYILLLGLLFNGTAGWAQQPVALQAEVYSAFLRDKFGPDIQLLSGRSRYKLSYGRLLQRGAARFNKITPLLGIAPIDKNAQHILSRISLANRIKACRFTREDTAQLPGGFAQQYLPIPVGTRIKAPGWELKEFVHNNPAMLLLGQKFDSLQQMTQLLPRSITLPGCQVLAESVKYFDGGWGNMEHSLGVVELSEIAFSADNRLAVFYMNKRPAGGCFSNDGFVFMEHTAEGWKTRFTTKLGWL